MDINNIYFYLLLGVFLYFLFTYILENYLVEQENFDPSLVPVSSIVTLAKVAQKLVNGNGTLTNPGNLQIGKDVGATSGNLTVTGKTAIGSTTMGDKTLNVTGTLGVSGDTTIAGATALNKPLTIKSGDEYGNTLNLLQGTGATGEPPYINFMKNDGTTINTYIMGKPNEILVDKNLTVGGNLNVEAGSGNNGININSIKPYISFNKKDGSVVPQLYSDGTVLHAYGADFKVDNNLTVDGMSNLADITATGNTELSGLATPLLIKKGTATPDNTKIQFGDGTGWRLRFQKNDANPIMDIYDDKHVNVHGDLTIGGTTRSQLTVVKLGQTWDDRGFIEKMVPYFKKSDPDGTRIDFMLVHDNGSIRLQSGVKYGNVMLRVFQANMNGHDIGDWGPNTTVSHDVWRINLIK